MESLYHRLSNYGTSDTDAKAYLLSALQELPMKDLTDFQSVIGFVCDNTGLEASLAKECEVAVSTVRRWASVARPHPLVRKEIKQRLIDLLS